MRTTPDPEILSLLVKRGIAHPNPHGDGSWGWTKLGKSLSNLDRGELSNMIWGSPTTMSYLFWPDLQKRFELPMEQPQIDQE